MLAILIPVFNDEDGLIRSLDSVLSAELPPSTTVVVVDDGSESVVSLPCRFAPLSPVLVRREVNQGIDFALNAGLGVCRSIGASHVARLDAGDSVTTDRFTKQLALFALDSSVGLVGSSARFVDETGKLLFVFDAPARDEEIRQRMAYSCCILHPTAIIRIDVLDRVGNYAETFKAAEDYELFQRMMTVCRAACVPEPLVSTVLTTRGISVQRRRRQLASRLRVQLKYFVPWSIRNCAGIVATVILMFIPFRTVLALKRHMKRSPI